MIYEIKILGCGGSTGVPDLERGFGLCDYKNPKNYRTRTSAFLKIDSSSNKMQNTNQFNVISTKSSIEEIQNFQEIHDFYQQLHKSKELDKSNNISKATQNKLEAQRNCQNGEVKKGSSSIGDKALLSNNLENHNFSDKTKENYNILFDVSPDFRQQALSNQISYIDSILFTHFHADHIYGIDNLREINRIINKKINAYANKETFQVIKNSFSYIFNGVNPLSNGVFYKPSLNFSITDYYKSIALTKDVKVATTLQNHGRINTMGFVVNNKIGYATDFVSLPQETIELYKNLDLLIVSAFTQKPHVSHMHLEAILDLLDNIKPKLTILTHMGLGMDYDNLFKILPNNVLPAYDGMIISNKS